jgi:hypothetical protein
MGLHLQFSWRDVAKSNESLLNVTWHGQMDLVYGVVPVEREAKVLRTFPISIDLVALLEYAGEMFDVFLVDVQADRAYGTEISPGLFVISFVILLYAISYNICI